MKAVKGSKITREAAPYYLELSKSYATLGKFSANPGPISINTKRCATDSMSLPKQEESVFKAKAAARHKSKTVAYIAAMNNDGIIDRCINLAEDKMTPPRRARAGKPSTQTRQQRSQLLGRRGRALETR